MLKGRTALVVEEEFLIALDIQRMLEGLGVGQTLFARTPAEAEALRAHWPSIAIALVEVRNDAAATLHLLENLEGAGIPTVLLAADTTMPPVLAPWSQRPLVVKPIPEDAMASAVSDALSARP